MGHLASFSLMKSLSTCVVPSAMKLDPCYSFPTFFASIQHSFKSSLPRHMGDGDWFPSFLAFFSLSSMAWTRFHCGQPLNRCFPTHARQFGPSPIARTPGLGFRLSPFFCWFWWFWRPWMLVPVATTAIDLELDLPFKVCSVTSTCACLRAFYQCSLAHCGRSIVTETRYRRQNQKQTHKRNEWLTEHRSQKKTTYVIATTYLWSNPIPRSLYIK